MIQIGAVQEAIRARFRDLEEVSYVTKSSSAMEHWYGANLIQLLFGQ